MLQGKTTQELAKLIDTARIPTVLRVLALESEVDTLKRQLLDAMKARPMGIICSSGEEDAKAKAEAAARQREVEMVADVPNPINEYVEMIEDEVGCLCRLHLQQRYQCMSGRSCACQREAEYANRFVHSMVQPAHVVKCRLVEFV